MLPKGTMPCAAARNQTRLTPLVVHGQQHTRAKPQPGMSESLTHHNGAQRMPSLVSIAPTQAPLLASLRRCAFTAAPQARACVLRRQRAQRHGVPTAFVSLSGVTAMLSTAVRKASHTH